MQRACRKSLPFRALGSHRVERIEIRPSLLASHPAQDVDGSWVSESRGELVWHNFQKEVGEQVLIVVNVRLDYAQSTGDPPGPRRVLAFP